MAPAEVAPSLFLGSMTAEMELDTLQGAGITHVLQVAHEVKPSHPKTFQYLRIPIDDVETQDLSQVFPQAFQFIDTALKQGGKVLVHCVMGISRSASVVCGYLMWVHKAPLDKTLATIKQQRRIANPNPGFMWQLELLEQNDWQLDQLPQWTKEVYAAHAQQRGVEVRTRPSVKQLMRIIAEQEEEEKKEKHGLWANLWR